ncbi:hypothetical protein [Streptomyces hygroscopicus]|uniref:hypothetical protein n=1 Tax=Streptomyces hygroscopicus TaxID=1912 RepID=UPI00223F3E6A|nr:hypothetical protein [Streptomyces hygroscopicus]
MTKTTPGAAPTTQPPRLPPQVGNACRATPQQTTFKGHFTIPAAVNPTDLADHHLEVVRRGSHDSYIKKAGQLVIELVALTVGFQPGDNFLPEAADLRWRDGALLHTFTYGRDSELAHQHLALLQHRLAAFSVAHFLAALAGDLSSHSSTTAPATPQRGMGLAPLSAGPSRTLPPGRLAAAVRRRPQGPRNDQGRSQEDHS